MLAADLLAGLDESLPPHVALTDLGIIGGRHVVYALDSHILEMDDCETAAETVSMRWRTSQPP